MDATSGTYGDRWNGPGGHAWVDLQPVLDGMFRHLEPLLTDAVPADQPRRVLDVGCGTGAVTLAVARRLGPAGHSVGVDISEPLVMAAQERAEREGTPASFIHADAQDHPFEPAVFDAVVSRFGVMFFGDSVKAFANLRRAVTDDGRLRLVVWRGPEENPFMTTAERAAAPLVDLPARSPGRPGQFAFADADRVRRILAESGWSGIDIRPADVECVLPEAALESYFTRLGPLSQVMGELEDRTREEVVEKVRAAFDTFVQGSDVRFTAAVWVVDARASSASVAS
ncbi:class I SAM-dependent methyltransferase [Streptomyces sp. NPDC048419]|uniref:class I SAM-dependent methyltransferase n=1 Tax=Streptomyces sp. NPDC048419 TaxID=3365547 RepID=UPI0037128886